MIEQYFDFKKVVEYCREYGESRITERSMEEIGKGKATVFAKIVDGIIVGFTALFNDNGVNVTVVIPEHRKKGYGTELLRHKIEYVEKQGLKFQTRIGAINIPSIKVALKCGLTLVGVEKIDTGCGVALIFEHKKEVRHD